MRLVLFVSLLLGFISTADARPADCLLEVQGRRVIDGACDFTAMPDGSFQISAKRGQNIEWFAQVQVSERNVAQGYWNGEAGARHAHYNLGQLQASGACWSNATARVCAWKIGERRNLSSSTGGRPPVSFPSGTIYADARDSLQVLGWKPAPPEKPETCLSDDGRCKGRPETWACSGTGLGHCLYVWRRGDTLVEIVTQDEEVSQQKVTSIRCRAGC
ncbi:hypothetical protein [Methylocella sp. CPCC 101449]|uniref:hypothetical protein n=1 Tax=Methylocella sp. CPCC 101449 TaxID=2987531 RepID=UPI00288F304D|nr:hypothetical protein [Methylocella sp. CPCC 101449]MDT2022425.1 hypothetical protein [Methylocella sp. CPCC 101449]